MIDSLLFPVLVGVFISVGFCGIRRSRKLRASFWLPFAVAGLTGAGFTLEAFRSSLFTAGLWTDNGVTDPAFVLVLFVFGFPAVASFIPSVLVVILYRNLPSHSHDAA
jgi:hypothetical protein